MAKKTIGIDVGSRATKIVWLEGTRITRDVVFDTGHDPMERMMEALEGAGDEVVVATGYGRNLVKDRFNCRVVTEITACARGAREVCPDCRSVIDIGGQDSKVMEVTPDGRPAQFEMNDRCAAGTGRFLEVMARTLGYTLEEFGLEAARAELPVPVNSMCTVFAESEVVGLIAQGVQRGSIALGLHEAVARRVAAMASRIKLGKKTLFVGGVARNACMARTLAETLGNEVAVPDRPELVVALGAGLIAQE